MYAMRWTPIALLLLLAGCRPPEARYPDLVAPDWNKLPEGKRQVIRQAWDQANQSPGDATLNGRVGMLLLAFGQPAAAASAFERAAQLQPDSFPSLYYLGQSQAAAGRTAEAIATLKNAARHHSTFLPLQMKLAELMKVDLKDAPDPGPDPWMQAVRDLNPPARPPPPPDARVAHFEKGRDLLARKKFKAGIEELKQTLTPTDGETPGYLYAVAKACALAGNYRDAAKYAAQAKIEAKKLGKDTLAEAIDLDLRLYSGLQRPTGAAHP